MKPALLTRAKVAASLAMSLVLTGCPSIMLQEREGHPSTNMEVLVKYPVGTPRVSITSHDDRIGWTVTAEQRIEHEIEEQTSQGWIGRRYVFSPPALLAGLVQCPLGLLLLFESNPTSNHRRHGCARLLMFEPLDGTLTLPPTVSSKLRIDQRWEPLGDGVVHFEWPGVRGQAITYSLDRQGRAEVRLAHLLSRLILSGHSPQLDSGQTLRIRLRHGDGTSVDHHVAVSTSQLQRARSSMPSPVSGGRWPQPLILQIVVDAAPIFEHERHFVRDRLMSWALQRHICAVVTEEFRPHLFDEHQVQYSGAVDDDKQIRLGQILPTSAILTASLTALVDVTLQVRTMRGGEILATVSGSSHPDSLRNLLDHTLTELDMVMANAPKIGCPTPPETRSKQSTLSN